MGEKLGRPALPSGVEGSRPYRPGLEGPETGLIVGHTTRQPATGNLKQRRIRQRKGLAFLKRILGHRLGGSYYMQMSPHPC